MEKEPSVSPVLQVTIADQYRTVEELFTKSRPSFIYYTLLILSVFIVVPGLLLDNGFIVIGGMLVTPVLTPVLLIALGFSVGETAPIKDAAMVVLKSFVLILLGGWLLAMVFGSPETPPLFENTMRSAVLYFVVALAAGIAATLSWTRKEIGEVLPGTAIALSLVPPLALIGISLGGFNLELARYYLLVLIFNLVGVIVGSILVFNLLKFYKSDKKVAAEANDQKVNEGLPHQNA